jgi:hypothetical protein
MAKNSDRGPARARASDDTERVRGETPSGRTPAVEQVLAEENLRRTRQITAHERRPPMGSLGTTALLIGLLGLAGVLGAWLLLAA